MSTNTLPSQSDMVANILDVFHAVDTADASAGMEWYAEAWAFCQDLAAECGVSAHVVAGIVAATSPLMSWDANKALAARIVRAGGLTSGYMGVALRKCDAILAGAPIRETLAGQKIVNFYDSIVSGGGLGMTIDRHAFDIAVGFKYADDARPAITKGIYAEVSDAYVAACEYLQSNGLRITPAELQSVTWVRWRQS